MKLLVATVIVLAACGSKPASTTTPKEAEGATVALPDVAFDKLDHDQRIEFMKQKVVPQMKVVFQAHDAKDFADFGCVTCHGKDAKDGHFDMPNPGLPKLNFNDMSKFDKEDIEWMEKQVEPTMAKILDMPLYSKENPKGFGCLACHTLDQ
jgi:mono/diheme cytochrome c family protein